MDTETACCRSETVALAEAVDCAALFAVTVTGLDGITDGATYVPELEIVPRVELPPCESFTNQFTVVLLVPTTVALNCCDCPKCKLVLVGDTDTETAAADVMVTEALAEAKVYTEDCAVTLTEVDGATAGARYQPALETVPTLELPPRTPFTSQFRPVLVVPDTAALNC
jgi:hypothetical protein